MITRFLVSHNNKGSNDNLDLDVIGGLGSLPQIDIYTASNISAGRRVGSGGYRTQLPGAFSFDLSHIDRSYKDRPAQVGVNQVYNC